MSTLSKYIDVLGLFSEKNRAWTVPAMANALGTSPSTLYRRVRELVDAGLLDHESDAAYQLGGAFIKFERLAQMNDPLLKMGAPILRKLVEKVDIPCVALLCRIYGNDIFCVVADASVVADVHPELGRGRPVPVTRGAPAKAILAHLPPKQRSSVLSHVSNVLGAPKSPRGLAFEAALADVRKQGIAIGRDEIMPDLVEFAAPVTSRPLGIQASLALLINAHDFMASKERRLIAAVVMSASALSHFLGGPAVTGVA
jgi:DNA-binding IclR family transcriptional regulator